MRSELREGVFNARYVLTDELTLRAGVAYHKFTQGGRDDFLRRQRQWDPVQDPGHVRR